MKILLYNLLSSFIQKFANKWNFVIIRSETLNELQRKANLYNCFKFFHKIPNEDIHAILPSINYSYSQFSQDIFVMHYFGMKNDGFFVEFGATDGVLGSNTYALEKFLNWNGILSEPAKCFQQDLKFNRNSFVDFDLVWSKTGESILFNEVGGLSTIKSFSSADIHAAKRKNGTTYYVNTISLLDLLNKYNAPNVIDYLSIDTEGSEYEILKNFDFTSYKILCITVEHNYSVNRDKIFKLLESKGYIRVYCDISEVDDWYILNNI